MIAIFAFFRYLALQFGTAQPGACQFHSVVECFSATSDIRDAPLLFITSRSDSKGIVHCLISVQKTSKIVAGRAQLCSFVETFPLFLPPR